MSDSDLPRAAEQQSPVENKNSMEDEGCEGNDVCEDGRCSSLNGSIWHCVDCDSNYCSECWGLQGSHKAGKFGRDGVPHEKTNVKVVSRLKSILQPPASADVIRKSHQEDQCTKWFGMSI